MWIPKTEEELKELTKTNEKIAKAAPLGMVIAYLLIAIIDAKYFGVKIEKFPIALSQPLLTWTQIFKSLPKLGIISLIIWTLGYLGLRKMRTTTTLICVKCKKIKGYDKVKVCDCGGHFKFLDQMKWIEDEIHENDKQETKENT
jgi:hypothetical protein